MNSSEPATPPQHIAIIMDGNGRWASERGLPRSAGHKTGIDALRRAVKAAGDLGVGYLTIYSFSTENWSRPKTEVSFLLDLLRRFIRQDVAELHASNVRIKIIGSRIGLDGALIKLLEDAERLTKDNTKLTLIVAFNYGARQEISAAFQKLGVQIASGALSLDSITPELISKTLDTAGIPDPDLLIRTGGEERLSNFLLWQCAYTELVFIPEYWPDFDGAILQRAIGTYHSRERRFGGLKAQTA
jgi:undecaprenyl diphosphate synthase